MVVDPLVGRTIFSAALFVGLYIVRLYGSGITNGEPDWDPPPPEWYVIHGGVAWALGELLLVGGIIAEGLLGNSPSEEVFRPALSFALFFIVGGAMFVGAMTVRLALISLHKS